MRKIITIGREFGVGGGEARKAGEERYKIALDIVYNDTDFP